MSQVWREKSVVIVDDSPGVRESMVLAYQQLNMKTLGTACNGIEALDLVAKLQPDLVSLDLIMPEMDVVECFKKLRRYYPETRVIVISWLGSEPKIIENLKSLIPAHVFLPKPLDIDQLSKKLDLVFEMPTLSNSPALSDDDLSSFSLDRRSPILGRKVS